MPSAPTVELVNIGALKYIKVTGTVPTGGITQYLDFNYGTSSSSETHTFYKTITEMSNVSYRENEVNTDINNKTYLVFDAGFSCSTVSA